MTKRAVGHDDFDEDERCRYHFYDEHKRTAAMSERKVASFRKKHQVHVDRELSEVGLAFSTTPATKILPQILVQGTEKRWAPVVKFKRAGMPRALVKAVCGEFASPSPIQAQCWPILLSGRDVVGIAATGSGKTIAFGLPGLVHVAARGEAIPRKPFMLVLAPTRELAMQTQEVCEAAGKHCNPPVQSVCVFGGVSKDPQKKALLRGVQVVIATPGRLIDLMGENCVDLSQVSYVVLDEADRMLDLGFHPDLQRILPQTLPVPAMCGLLDLHSLLCFADAPNGHV